MDLSTTNEFASASHTGLSAALMEEIKEVDDKVNCIPALRDSMVNGEEKCDMSFVPGDVVLTTFGVGVISRCPENKSEAGNEAGTSMASSSPWSSYQILLWRIPGKSIGSSSTAYLQADAIIRHLPAAPGMTTTAKSDKSKRLLVQSYSPSTDTYLVSHLPNKVEKEEDDEKSPDDDDELDATVDGEHDGTSSLSMPMTMQKSIQKLSRLSLAGGMMAPQIDVGKGEIVHIASNELTPAASAKFYPLIQELIRRGDQTASATNEFLQQKPVANLIGKTTTLVENRAEAAKDKLLQNEGKIVKLKSSLKETVDGVIPKEEQVQQLLQMIKDDELTVLLNKGRDRLEQLVRNEIPQATEKALERTGIRVVLNEDEATTSPYMETIQKSRQAALSALEEVLQQADMKEDIQAIRGGLEEKFTTMFDSLASAAKSDRTLSSIFDTVSGKTTEWQEATGRLMSTRAAGLFLEGASRFQARAATLFSKDQLNWAGEVGSKFTKAFTEGDAAVARLKSIELGEKMKQNLVSAIEIRSESLGGLDGIIAGALSAVQHQGGGEGTGTNMKEMLTSLQSQASSVTKDAHETLISVLARRSEYRDVALLKIEQVMCDLESQFGDDLSPQDIAAIARGEGGTAKLFEPIAKRAAKEIEKQLDMAEESVTDPTIADVLKHVRKIVSGELTFSAVMDEVVNILNDDKVVAAGEELVKHGEHVLDAIEGVSGNAVVDEVMQIAEKAGITKDAVMEGIENLDVNELLDTAGNAMTDESARKELLSNATDTALDFLLRILPSMPVPPFDGVKDGLVYHFSNLSMEGFKVRKENIVVKIAGMRATKRKKKSPNVQEGSDAVRSDDSASWLSRTASTDSDGAFDFDTDIVGVPEIVKASELLIIDVREVSALFNNAVWSFEQTYMPYLKGSGQVDVKMSDGAIRLVFELRRRRSDSGSEKSESKDFEAADWTPVLCLHDRNCSIGSVELNMQGGTRLAWVVNKLASIFKGVLRDYVVRTILSILTDKSGWILSKLNEGISPYWGILMKTAKLEMEGLEVATEKDVVAASPPEDVNLIELVWREQIPLGMNLLLNDESGQLKVVDFPRGSQARTVCERRNLDPEAFEGATIVAVNGRKHQSDEDLFEALRDPGRPKTISFELADSEVAERIRKFVEESRSGGTGKPDKPEFPAADIKRTFQTREVEFLETGELGIEFGMSADNFGLVVRRFLEGDDGIVLAAARKADIHQGDLLTHINGQVVLGENGSGSALAMKLLEEEGEKRPLRLSFADAYLFRVVFEKTQAIPLSIGGPSELLLEELKFTTTNKLNEETTTRRIVVKGFNNVDGVAEHSGVLIGDHLVFVNGTSVGSGCKWLGEESTLPMEAVRQMLEDPNSYPIGLTFARPVKNSGQSMWNFGGSPRSQDNQFTMDSAETICVTAEAYEQVGAILDMRTNHSEIVVTDFEAVPGPFHSIMKKYADRQTGRHHFSIESVNGQFVPGYATTKMVSSAMDRSWKSDNSVELLFCDDERKQWTHSLAR